MTREEATALANAVLADAHLHDSHANTRNVTGAILAGAAAERARIVAILEASRVSADKRWTGYMYAEECVKNEIGIVLAQIKAGVE